MAFQQFPIRHKVSVANPALIESWCLKCGMFIAASNDEQKLQTAEHIHSCTNSLEKPPSPRRPDGEPRPK
jgi:hypothetical protein